MNKEEFDRYAYAYRSWPSSDPAGVVARFDELTAYVDGLIVAGKLSTLRTASDKIATGEQFRHNCVINMVNEFWRRGAAPESEARLTGQVLGRERYGPSCAPMERPRPSGTGASKKS